MKARRRASRARAKPPREREEQWRTLFKGVPLPTFAWKRVGGEFVLTGYNDSGDVFTQGHAAKLVGLTARSVYADAPEIVADLERCFAERATIRRELSYRFRWSGEARPVAVTYGFVPPDIVLAHVEDITHRRRAEQALQLFRSLVDRSSDAIEVVDTETGRIVEANETAWRSLRYTRDEFLSLRVPDVNPAVDAAFFARTTDEVRRRGSLRFEGTRRRKDGTTFPMEVNLSYVRLDREYVVAVVRDITERQHAEDALRQSEAKYRSLVEHAVHGIYRSTLDGRMLAANPALVAMLGYASEDEVLALDMARDLYADPAERRRLVARYEHVERYDGVEVAWKRKDGTPITVRLSGRPTRLADGTLAGFEMLVEDVSARRVLEQQLRQAQKMEAIGQLAGGLAHDFNNLLTAVLSSCDLVAAALPPDSPAQTDVATVCGAAQRGVELTQKLLAFGRRQPLKVETLSLGALASDFSRMARRVVPEDVDVKVLVAAPETTVEADPGAIEQILMNLVTNARDAMPTGGTLAIEVGRQTLDEDHRHVHGWGEPGEYVTLAVADTGTGMDAEAQRRIFEPFFTTKPVGEGTGLGMSMVYGLVKEHEGFVKVYSEVGRGTTVRVYFPAAAGAGAEAEPVAAPAVRGGTETILLVEDDEAVRRAATRVLEKAGYTVVTAVDGYEALDVLEARDTAPDLIVSDVVMPRISGPHLLSKLRQAGSVPKMLFTSGYTARDVKERTQLEPGLPFLAKPWTVTDLLRMVREVLDAPSPGPGIQ